MNRPDVLNKIAASVEQRLSQRKTSCSYEEMLSLVENSRKPKPFLKTDITGSRSRKPQIIAEIKFQSPSQSRSAHQPSVQEALGVAESYLLNGASALSILTERDHFLGDLDYLKAVRARFPSSIILMKDFIVDPYQLLEARVLGADCILLIVALLGPQHLESLYIKAIELGLSVLVEVHNEIEMMAAIALGASIIGINNRNLKDLTISLDTSRQLVKMAPPGSFLVCESGLESSEEIKEMSQLGFSAFLIGTSLMKTVNPGETLGKLLAKI